MRIEVRNAQFDVKQNRTAVQAAQSAVDLARQTLDADQQKLKVGLTTQTVILQDAATLTTGESNMVSARQPMKSPASNWIAPPDCCWITLASTSPTPPAAR